MKNHASLLLTGGRVYTGLPNAPWAEAVALGGDRILFVGTTAEAEKFNGPATEVIALAGNFLMPGLIDAHFHLLWQVHFRAGVCVDDLTEISALQATLSSYAESHPGTQDDWILGRGFSYELFSASQPPHRALLDAAVPNRPLLLSSFDMHTFLANTRALEMAGLLHGDPETPGFMLDENGIATGEMREFAALARMEKAIPALTPEAERAFFLRQQANLHRFGITAVQNKDGDADQLAFFRDLEADGLLRLRVQCPLMCPRGTPPEAIAEWRATHGSPAHESPYIRTTTIKLFYDGVIDSGTAAVLSPYQAPPFGHGETIHAAGDYDALVRAADAEGFQVVTHAIGDAAVRAALDAYASVPGTRRLRHRIEHIEILDPADLPRFRELGVVISVQPIHACFADIPAYRALIGPERHAWCFPFRTLIEAGNVLALGSDHPVATYDPRVTIAYALSRPPYGGPDAPAATSRHDLSIEEILAGYTRHAAYADHHENQIGVLTAGAFADLAVFDADPFTMAPEDFANWNCTLTVSGGQIVHRSGI